MFFLFLFPIGYTTDFFCRICLLISYLIFSHLCPPPHRDVLGVEYLTDHMDGAGEDLKVNKGSSADKSRSNYRKQDRKYRQMEADTFNDGDGFAED